MSARLFHTEIGLPEKALARWLGKSYRLRYTQHALGEILRDKYGVPKKMPVTLRLLRSQIFEMELTGQFITKFAVRLSSMAEAFTAPRPGLDLILVLAPEEDNTLVVTTCWFNETTDSHATLDVSKYERANF